VERLADNHPLALAADNRNLWTWDGYGLNSCAVDSDSKLRVDSEVTHPRMRIQLPKRVFEAAPDLSHGQPMPDAQSRMVYGQESSLMRKCDRLSEVDFNRFDPGVHKVPVYHIVPPWTNGGDPSRDIAKSDCFLKAMGYTYDGRIWRRPQATSAV
jgi:hypothetical protein